MRGSCSTEASEPIYLSACLSIYLSLSFCLYIYIYIHYIYITYILLIYKYLCSSPRLCLQGFVAPDCGTWNLPSCGPPGLHARCSVQGTENKSMLSVQCSSVVILTTSLRSSSVLVFSAKPEKWETVGAQKARTRTFSTAAAELPESLAKNFGSPLSDAALYAQGTLEFSRRAARNQNPN